jgi:hypothetical protein
MQIQFLHRERCDAPEDLGLLDGARELAEEQVQ